MDAMSEHDPDAGFEPAFAAPANACDAHFHVFGAADKYAYGTDIRYKPPYEPVERYLKLAQRLGLVRYVFVQPSAYGFDNSCMLDAMRQLDPAIRRGIIDLDETKVTDNELSELDALGVRGIRVNISPIRKPESGLAASMRPRIYRLAKICAELAWHLDFLTPEEKDVFKTSFEIDQRWLLELAADRTPYIDQAQSLNLFIPADVDKWDLLMLHYRAWELGIKSLYYLRSKSIQRAGFAGGVEADNTIELKQVDASETDYDECLACQ